MDYAIYHPPDSPEDLVSERQEQLDVDVFPKAFETSGEYWEGAIPRALTSELPGHVEFGRLVTHGGKVGTPYRIVKVQIRDDPDVKIDIKEALKITEKQDRSSNAEEQLDEINAALKKSRELGERAQRNIDALLER